tara:strand:+ start:2277 stop:2378 length:102 start_codon:yes stop_codon:yes gene_type:complete
MTTTPVMTIKEYDDDDSKEDDDTDLYIISIVNK